MTANTVAEATNALKAMNLQQGGDSCNDEQKWGFELYQLYQLAVKFYKEKEGKALQLSYSARLQFVGLAQLVAHGPCRPDTLRPLGVLDVVGRDRRDAWLRLGELDRREAMTRYIEMLDAACPIFRPFAEAHKRDLEAQQRRREEERAAEEQRQRRQKTEERERHQREEERSRRADTKRYIQDALNRQTYPQFRAYAAQQYPGNPEQQAVLIRKLQQQHYQQYMQQLFQQQFQHRRQQQQEQSVAPARPAGVPDLDDATAGHSPPSQHSTADVTDISYPLKTSAEPTADREPGTTDGDPGDLAVARMWTRADLAHFKAARRAEQDSAVITVGQGEVVTVRVPALEGGTCLFWEFATDGSDLGFGVWFEWGPTAQRQVSIEVSQGAGEEQREEREEEEEEEGPVSEVSAGPCRYRTSCVVPVYRRDCHLHVYAGSHRFPAHQGVYLLQFDNSYSLWRAKTLYFRVFYTR